MNELMRAGLFRMKRDRVFWLCLGAMLIIAGGQMSMGVRQCRAMAAEGYTVTLEGSFFPLIQAVMVCVAVFTGLYLGTDHSEGGLRNRLMVGHGRGRIYLAGLGTAMTGTICFMAAWFLGGGLPALFYRDLWQMGAGQTGLYILVALFSALALTSVLTMVGMLAEKKSTAAVVSILLALGLVLASTWLYSRLLEPEMESGLIITAGGMEWGDPTPNPRYVSGALRQVFQGLLNLLPTGQAVLLADMTVDRPLWNLLASAAVILTATLGGMAAFRRKDLK
ncbi:MAG: ABC transporter permease [Oscillospiraceae bacterium]|jgi:ABC-2 type transport system permease protein|nr:ABC transporter permease [Oscillospiraceae bacterium]